MGISMERWQEKVAIVTGASSGIGASIAEELANAGVKVVGLARRKNRLDELSKKLQGSKAKFHGIVCDISKEADIVNTFKWVKENVGPIHILVNNAGIRNNTTLFDGDAEKWKQVLDTNVLGLCIATREAVINMRENNIDGHIIHINSVSGHKVHLLPGFSVYSASKHAVTALTETLRQELNSIRSRIKITSISPGVVATEFRKAAGLLETEEQRSREAQLPYIESKDVADAVVYVLATPPHVQVHEMIIKPVGEVN